MSGIPNPTSFVIEFKYILYIFCFNKAVPTNCIQMTDKSILRKHNQLNYYLNLIKQTKRLKRNSPSQPLSAYIESR